ncbi:hypothetical protein, partial [Pseudoponticoccus marisrubri]|uniref:hypothetical protein n=1 Tax=Pseudoponticoccus marisrubri TaxID=1685382 RepID=UPI000ACD3AFF
EQSRRDIVEQFDVAPEQVTLVHNGIDTALFRPLADIEQRPFRIMTTASADQPLKGLRFLLEAVAELRQTFPQLELLVVGRLKEE